MRQQIKHGAMIDAATPDEVAEAFRTFLRDNVRKDREEYRIEKGAVLLDGGGNGQLHFQAPAVTIGVRSASQRRAALRPPLRFTKTPQGKVLTSVRTSRSMLMVVIATPSQMTYSFLPVAPCSLYLPEQAEQT